MRNIVRIIGMSLASMAGILLVAGIASAQALKTPIEGSWTNGRLLGEPEREWVDEDGITHVRGQRYRVFHIGDIVGREDGVFDFDSDPDAGTRFEHGTSSFGGQILGVPASATNHWTVECTRPPGGLFTCTEEDVWHLEDGRLFKLSATYVGGGFPTPYTGILLDPPGLRLGANRRGR